MTDWQTVRFGSLLAQPVRNGIYKKKEFHGRGAKMVNMGELFAYSRLTDVPMKRVDLSDKELNRFSLEKGDLIFARRSLTAEGAGKCTLVAEVLEPTAFESSIIRARPEPSLASSDFLYYYFASPAGHHSLDTIRRQVAVAGITGSDLSNLEFRVPGLKIQQEIASVLSALDNKIELNRRMNETLEAQARALFRDWFVDFGPVKAKMAGDTPYLAPNLWSLFPNCLDDDGVPEGWNATPLDEIASFLNGLALQKYPAADGDDSLPVIKITELRTGPTSKSNRASTDVPGKYVIGDGDFIFSWSGSLLAKFWTHGPGALNQHLFKVTSDEFPPWFYSHWVWHHLAEFQLIAASKATTMGHIKRGHLKEAMCVVPAPDLLEKLSAIMEPLVERTIANELESRTLAQTRDLLLPKLMSGETRVGEAEREIEHA
ncbi:restriction endonuclease subunit S [Altererythrobacter sp. MTPC7]|uniref:restriction endonuclease subunit S n=1 Tax=Altererythrobacter sp. MTPC7 TaxID=3056567 RepID=UPI0036F19BD8